MFPASPLPTLLAADNRLIKLDLPSFGTATFQIPGLFFLVLGLIVASFAIGIWIANSIRMKDYGWKIGLILATTLSSLAISLLGQYKLGVDLQGGVILVYEVNEEETKQLVHRESGINWDMDRLVKVLRDRLNETGLKEIVVRPFGPKQIEIVVPEVDEEEVRKLEEKITTGGTLQFMIVATEIRDGQLFELARARAATLPAEERNQRPVINDEGEQEGYWARMSRERSADPDTAPFRTLHLLENALIRDARTGQILELTPAQRFDLASDQTKFRQFLNANGAKDIDVLMVYDAEYNIQGETDLAGAAAGMDPTTFGPCIEFTMRGEGEFKMGNLTARNIQRQLGIVFDNELKSAANIKEKITRNGQITGKFTEEEVQFVVDILKSGSLPVVLHKTPISKNTIGSILGLDTIKKGSWSIVIALSLVFLFMAAYYRFAGVVASFALALNLLLTVAFMVMAQAPFTLPGLAGLVLTVAMSVDANVLISERMREELARGATLRMAIRNGFDKALSAIIDGNLTTFMTALILYIIGTDQIRGFGMTLMLGNITSMFTAIFCARVILDVAERTRLVKTLSMANFLPAPQIDWVRYFVPGVVASVVLFAIGVGATVARGKGLFDTDLAGGTSVAFILRQPLPEAALRQKLDAVFHDLVDETTKTRVDYNVYSMAVESEQTNSVYKVDSSLEDIDTLKAKVREALKEPDGQEGLRTFEMTIDRIEETKAATSLPRAAPPGTTIPGTAIPGTAPPGAAAPPTGEPAAPATNPPATNPPGTSDPAKNDPGAVAPPASSPAKPEGDDKPDSSGCQDEATTGQDAQSTTAQPDPKSSVAPPAATTSGPAAASETPPAATPAATPPVTTQPSAPGTAPAVPAAAAPAPPAEQFESTATLHFPRSAITAAALREHLRKSASAAINRSITIIDVDNPAWDKKDNSAFEQWTVKLALSKADATKLFAHLQGELHKNVVWQTSSKIGGQVSVDTRWRALGALMVSLLCIVAYVWFRFYKPAWGLAAVAALAHDALSMLTAIALSYWFAGALGFLGVEEFKISLPVVAAFLTILGYSVNDTIVIFDRLREIRGKSPDITRDMLNAAVNQTLSRTIILAGITLTVVGVLYFFGGPGIHGFAFALLIGVISGCYTTLIIAAPLLFWLLGRTSAARVQPAAREMLKTPA